MFHLNDGLSVFSGSLSSHTHIYFTICLLIQTCGGHKVNTTNAPPLNFSTTPSGHEVTTSNRPLLNSSTTSSEDTVNSFDWLPLMKDTTSPADSSSDSEFCISDIGIYAIAACGAALLLSCILFAWWKKKQKDAVSTLIEQKKDITTHSDQLKSQLEEVKQEWVQNSECLQEVEKTLEDRAEKTDDKQQLLREKESILQSKWKLDQIKEEKERELLQTRKLLQTLDTITNSLKTA